MSSPPTAIDALLPASSNMEPRLEVAPSVDVVRDPPTPPPLPPSTIVSAVICSTPPLMVDYSEITSPPPSASPLKHLVREQHIVIGDTNNEAEIKPLNSQTDTGGSVAEPETQEHSVTAKNGPLWKILAARKAIEEIRLLPAYMGKLLTEMKIQGWNSARQYAKEYL